MKSDDTREELEQRIAELDKRISTLEMMVIKLRSKQDSPLDDERRKNHENPYNALGIPTVQDIQSGRYQRSTPAPITITY